MVAYDTNTDRKLFGIVEQGALIHNCHVTVDNRNVWSDMYILMIRIPLSSLPFRLGPQIDATQMNKILQLIKTGQSQGAKMTTGGSRYGEQGKSRG